MKEIKTNRLFQIIYPIVVYFLVYQVGVSFLIQIFGDRIGKVTCLLIAGLVCLIPIYILYNRYPKLIPEDSLNRKTVISYVLWVIGVVAFAIILNVILTHSSLVTSSEGFKRANATLNDGSVVLMLLSSGIVIPILEEILIRGIVVGQLYLWVGRWPSIVISSICFGILHNNIVQFIYAIAIGFVLSFMYTKHKRLSLCIIAHGLINIIVILFS
ncbi:CPBP family intramembrane glutamic endopeptidase [Pseudobutyrivibrio sp.]|uniref:CPBP family intramembrane glutamic endopeptidase n=1 Tax=Pseudobutyrivibrio sp. TaxID=2014367 RepID=UPI0025FB58FD|nr:type II CAAX endopeptidase family protein [Pseudobutyrivibrio sp.]MBR5648552.1 CPBP family intramembrane metalloprotease [Pseudobutyrivibrio sp.]